MYSDVYSVYMIYNNIYIIIYTSPAGPRDGGGPAASSTWFPAAVDVRRRSGLMRVIRCCLYNLFSLIILASRFQDLLIRMDKEMESLPEFSLPEASIGIPDNLASFGTSPKSALSPTRAAIGRHWTSRRARPFPSKE